MADSIRLMILKALTIQLQSITPANGYEHDLSAAIFRGRSLYGRDSPQTMISILESPRPDNPDYAGENDSYSHETWQLLLQGWTYDDQVNPTDPLYSLMADIEACLYRIISVRSATGTPLHPESYLLGKKISSLQFGPGVVRPVSETSTKAFFYLPLRVGLAKEVG